jgi:hypothetical protein
MKATITAPDGLKHGDSFIPTFTPGSFTQKGSTYLYATVDCVQDGIHVLGGQMVDLEGKHPANAGPFLLDNPGRWDAGPASCRVRMFSFDFSNARTRDLASDEFEVAG